jgi:beta-fructofuranosidase
MDNPAGAFYHDGLYHVYFEWSNDTAGPGKRSWGHATSENLSTWSFHPVAISNTTTDAILAGSVVFDEDNTSGLFPDTEKDQGNHEAKPNLVAFYTQRRNGKDTAAIATSTDGGDTFTKYDANPVLSLRKGDLRNPNVIWHKESKRWVMTASRAKEGFVSFYNSPDLINWEHTSDFKIPGGLLGSWELASLVPIPIVKRNRQGRDVREPGYTLFISFTDGSPHSSDGYGSVVRWFPGTFDGESFILADDFKRTLDFGPDFYATTFFTNDPTSDAALSISRAANLLYAKDVPSGSDGAWRGIMTLPRECYMIAPDLMEGRPDWKFFSRPAKLDSVSGSSISSVQAEDDEIPKVRIMRRKKMIVEGTIRVDDPTKVPSVGNESIFIKLALLSESDDITADCTLVIHQGGADLDCSRGLADGDWKGPEGDAPAMGIHDLPPVIYTEDTWHILVIVDSNIMEVYLNGGEQVGTMTFFPADPVSALQMSISGKQGLSMSMKATPFKDDVQLDGSEICEEAD